jgi:hypothetical protein
LTRSLKFCGQNLLLILLVLFASEAFGQKGSVIVIQTKGLVEAISPNGAKLKEPVVRGSVLPEGYSIKTNLFSESVLLLSNGTTATIQENSVFKLLEFKQKPFDTQNQSFGQLENEPSTSQVTIEMELGSLVVQTKKLNKSSSFSIRTPTGTAGIRGTQFQLASSPNTGMQLDVAESQVAFTPAGQNQPVVVGPGRGLDASPNGTIKQRPINPIVSQNITAKNSAASSICAAVPLATAKQANSKSASNSSNDGIEEDSADDGDDEGDSTGEDKSNEDSGDNEAAESFIKQSSNSIRPVPGQQTSSTYLEKVLGILNPADESSANDAPPPPPSGSPPSTRPPVSNFRLSLNPENTNDLGLILDFQEIDFLGNDLGVPTELSENTSRDQVSALLGRYIEEEIELFAASIALETFLKHPPYNSYDNVNESFRQAWFLTSLFFHELTGVHAITGDHTLKNIDWVSVAEGAMTPGAVLNARDLMNHYDSSPYLYDLGKALINEGVLGNDVTNRGVALGLLDLFNADSGISLPNSFSLGVLGDGNILNAALLGATHNDLLDALDSPEKQRELAKLFKLYPENLNGVLGADIHIGSATSPTTVNLGQWLEKATIFEGTATANSNEPSNNKKVFAFAAGKDLHLAGDVTFENSVNGVVNKTEDHALVLGSAQQTNIGHVEGSGALTSTTENPYPTKINFEGSNLGIGSYEDLTLTNVAIDVGGNLALGTLSDMHITQTDISVGRHSDRDNVYMYADELLQAYNLTFSGRTREIYMEANTIDLRDVHFPGGSEVMLRSRDGIPNFYGPNTSNANASYKPFHVNFYSNSNSYGGQAIAEGEFIQKTHGVDGYNSQTFKTATGDAAIKIRAFPK